MSIETLETTPAATLTDAELAIKRALFEIDGMQKAGVIDLPKLTAILKGRA